MLLCMWLVMEVKSDAVKNNITILHRNLECQVYDQGKLEVVKQEMARVNINILWISELKRTRMGEFNSDDHYVDYCGQESLRRNGIALIVNKRVQNTVLGCSLKKDRNISVHFWGKPLNITVIQVHAPNTNAKDCEVKWFYEDLQDLLELTPKLRHPFHRSRLKCKSRKSGDTWSNRQVWPWNTEWSRAEGNSFVKRMYWS